MAALVGFPVLTLELEGAEGLEGLEVVVGELALVVEVDEPWRNCRTRLWPAGKSNSSNGYQTFQRSPREVVGRLVVCSSASTPRRTPVRQGEPTGKRRPA